MIETRNLIKTFVKNGTRIEVLRGINIHITRGESLAILGTSGAGKTTFLQILGILDHPTSGDIIFNGENVFEWNDRKRAEIRNRKIGFVFQFHHLLPEFTTLENTMMPALIHGITRGEARRRAEITLTEVGLDDRLSHKPGELSGGEQQRVAVARAMLMEPEILLADEPTGNLDTETGSKIEDLLLNLCETKGSTLVVVTHNRSLARRMSRVTGLRDGELYDIQM
ncbi:MAG: ABC transporter ATP-binding protein [Syntrophobacterales bacterium]|jgi:lipoprotein-releasing system ATP-binding protein|nr:MAG: ABC transporter ATP-binding protein [Syntrophobacterales bacterium]